MTGVQPAIALCWSWVARPRNFCVVEAHKAHRVSRSHSEGHAAGKRCISTHSTSVGIVADDKGVERCSGSRLAVAGEGSRGDAACDGRRDGAKVGVCVSGLCVGGEVERLQGGVVDRVEVGEPGPVGRLKVAGGVVERERGGLAERLDGRQGLLGRVDEDVLVVERVELGVGVAVGGRVDAPELEDKAGGGGTAGAAATSGTRKRASADCSCHCENRREERRPT